MYKKGTRVCVPNRNCVGTKGYDRGVITGFQIYYEVKLDSGITGRFEANDVKKESKNAKNI